MRIQVLLPRLRARVAFWALAGVALLVSHDAVFLAQLGPGSVLAQALRDAAHDYWGPASLAVAVVGAGATLAIAVRMLRLQRRAAALGARPRRSGRRGYLPRVASVWLALVAVVAIGFLIQENLEHARVHGHLIGTAALVGPEYPLALPVIALITLCAALLGAAISGAEGALVAAIAEVLRHLVLPGSAADRACAAPPRIASPIPPRRHAGRPRSSPTARHSCLITSHTWARCAPGRICQCSSALDGLPSSAPC